VLTIGKIAALSGTTPDTLRFYEREGLVVPSKGSNGYRRYGDDALQRIQFIKHAQQCGFTLAEIREMLLLRKQDSACCNDVRSLTIEKKLQVEQKIRTLQSISRALDDLIKACMRDDLPLDECPILAALDHAIEEKRGGGNK
jgi:MerR family Zn(II)-responsive transcriptional regulator of zntA